MKNKAVILEYFLAVLGYLEGIALCLSLVFLPIGIYAISGANLFLATTKLTDSEIGIIRNRITNYGVLFSIILFPVGLLALLIVPICAGHNIKVETSQDGASEENMATIQPKEATQRVVSEEELAKLEQLRKYRDQGIITEEEFIKAKQSIFED